MEPECIINTSFFRRLFVVSTFIKLAFVVTSCGLLWHAEEVQVFPKSIIYTQRYEQIPPDSMVTCPIIKLKDTMLYKSFDDIINLNSTYLTHAKHGSKTWFEVNITTTLDTTNINIYARQYTNYNRIEPGQYDGVVQYKDYLFLTRFDSASNSYIERCINDSITFNKAYQGMVVYFIVDYNYNFPEYAYAQYVYHNGLFEKKRVEINNLLLKNGLFREKD